MRINRRFLYIGTFLVALGAVLVAADLGALDLAAVRDALRLWPLAIVLVGVALVIRRSPAALPVGLLAAGAPGLVLGAAIAVGPRFVTDCASPGPAKPARVVGGAFGGDRNVTLQVRCGVLRLRADPAVTGWTASLDDRRGPAPAIDAADGSLTVDATGAWSWPELDDRRDGLQLVLPSGDLGAVSASLTATDAVLDLANTRVGSLDITSSASDVLVDLSGTSISTVSATASFGQLTLIVPAAANLTGDLKVSGGHLRICAAPVTSLQPNGLRVTGRGFADQVVVDGEPLHDGVLNYETPFYETAIWHADLRVNASFGSVTIDPNGGCK